MSKKKLYLEEGGLVQPQECHDSGNWPAKVIEVKVHPQQYHLRVEPFSGSAAFTLVLTLEGHSPNVPGVHYQVKNPGEQQWHSVTVPGPKAKKD